MTDDGPCRCWMPDPAYLHEGHCCFANLPDDTPVGGPLPCGHWNPQETKP